MKNKLKIGFFTDTYLPQVNGVVSSIELFRQELERLGHEVYIFCPKIEDEEDTEKIMRFHSFKFLFQPEYHVSIPFSRHLLKGFWTKDLDIVHAHTPFSIGLLGYYYAYIKRVPFIHTYHTLYPEYIKAYILKGKLITPKMVAKLSAYFSNRCDLTIAPSEKIKSLLKDYGVEKPIVTLATGIKIEEFSKKAAKNDFRKKYGLKNSDKLLLYVGRLGKEKNIDFLIQVLGFLNKKSKNYKLILVGDGPHKVQLKKIARKLNLSGNVIFTGYFFKPELIKAYQASDFFVFASLTDTQGLVIMEAAASGLPIVAIKDKAFKNILKDKQNGFATSEDTQEFAEKIKFLTANKKLYRKMSKKSGELANQFSIKRQTQKLVKIYRNLIIKNI